MSLRKWDIAWAGLDPAQNHEQGGRRPVLVFCNDVVSVPIGFATVLPLTTLKKGRRVYPTEVLLPPASTGLPSPSLVLCHQVRTLATARLSPPAGRLEDAALREAVEKSLRLWLDLTV